MTAPLAGVPAPLAEVPAQPPAAPFVMAGDPSAAACIGDSCEIPASDQAAVNKRLDENRV